MLKFNKRIYSSIIRDEINRMSREILPYETEIRTAVRKNKKYINIINSPELCQWDLINDEYRPNSQILSNLEKYFESVKFEGLKGYNEHYKCFFN